MRKPDITAATRQPLYSGWEWKNKAAGIIITVKNKYRDFLKGNSLMFTIIDKTADSDHNYDQNISKKGFQ